MDEILLKQLENYSNRIATKQTSEDINLVNKFLTDNIKLQNYEILSYLLINSSFPNSRFYAANSLIQIITSNYLTITYETVLYLQNYTLDFLVYIIFT